MRHLVGRWRRLVSGGLLALTVAVSTTPTHAAQPVIMPAPIPASPNVTTSGSAPAPTIQQTTINFSWTDAQAWADQVFARVLVHTLQDMAAGLHGVVDGLVSGSGNFVTRTPPGLSYDSGAVSGLWDSMRLVANVALALVALWGGFTIMAHDQIGTPYHEALALFPRLVVGALLANTSRWIGQLAIDVENGLCGAIGQPGLPAWDHATTTSQALADVLGLVVYLVGALALVLQMLMRLALVDVLLVVSPLALLCWVLPQTQHWSRLWSSLLVGTVFVQVVQVTALRLGGDLVQGVGGGGLVGLLLGLAIVLLVLRLPSLMQLVGMGSGWGAVVAGAQVVRGAVRSSSGSTASRPAGASAAEAAP